MINLYLQAALAGSFTNEQLVGKRVEAVAPKAAAAGDRYPDMSTVDH